jgi:hypothetical protein
VLDPAARVEFERQYRLVLLIYFAMLASIFLYLGIGFVLVRALSLHPGVESTRPVVMIFYGLAAVLIAVIWWIRKSRISPLLSPATGDVSSLISKYRAGHIVVFVLCETITFFGFVLLFLVGSFTHLVYFALLSLIIMMISYPQKAE